MLDYYQYNMVKDDDELNNIVNRSVAEAKLSRAYAHFMLATLWDNPPLVDHTIAGDVKLSNTPHSEIIDWCIKEVEEAAQYLPSKSNINDQDLTIRFTKEFAYALKGKIEVFNGKYDDAKKSLKKVIDSHLYELVDGKDMHKLYHVAGDCCKEWLFQYNYVEHEVFSAWVHEGSPLGDGQFSPHYVNGMSWRNLNFFPEQTIPGWGTCNPTKEFGDALIENDGIDSWRRQSWIVTYDELLSGKTIGEDVILSYKKGIDLVDAYVVGPNGASETPVKVAKTTKYDTEKEEYVETWAGPNNESTASGVYGNAGYWEYKRLPLRVELDEKDKGSDNQHIDVNYPIMRYAEVLLLYAEACANAGDDGSGLAALNEVQNRAGSKHISSSLTLKEVKNEKRFECFMEGMRYIDLVRWGDAKAVLGEQGKSVPTASTKFDEVDGIPRLSLNLNWRSYNETYGFQDKHEHMPYPYSATSINSNLKQNPGY